MGAESKENTRLWVQHIHKMSGPAYSDLSTFRQDFSLPYLQRPGSPKTIWPANLFVQRIAMDYEVRAAPHTRPLPSPQARNFHSIAKVSLLKKKKKKAFRNPLEAQPCRPPEPVSLTTGTSVANLEKMQTTNLLFSQTYKCFLIKFIFVWLFLFPFLKLWFLIVRYFFSLFLIFPL